MDSGTFRRSVIPALIGAGICLFFQRSGVLTLFFLVPLGVVAFRYNYRIAWIAVLAAVLGNVILTVETAVYRSVPVADTFWDLLYFSVMVSLFTWITAPPPVLSRVSGAMRLMIASCAGALLFTGIFFRLMAAPGFSEYLNSLINTLSSFYRSSGGAGGADVVQNALLESLTPDAVLNFMKTVMLRGGSLVFCVFMFFICRQVSFFIGRLTLGNRFAGEKRMSSARASSLVFFHVYPAIIWFFSVSLLLVVLSRMAKLEIPEIILWNILIFCAILYFAQGFGILLFLLARPSMPPSLRLLLSILFIIMVFSPGINAVLLGGVVLLGIAENWVPFRAPIVNGPPSTPGAGDVGN